TTIASPTNAWAATVQAIALSNRDAVSSFGKARKIAIQKATVRRIQRTPPPKNHQTIPNGTGRSGSPRNSLRAPGNPKLVTGVRLPFSESSARFGKQRAKETADARSPR